MRHYEQGLIGQAEQGCISVQSCKNSSGELPQAELRISERVVILHKQGRAGTLLRIAVPLDHYRGVGVDIRFGEEGLSCAVALAHDNKEFEVILFEARDDENILAEWNSWSQRLKLPMMIRTEHGDVMARPQFGPLNVSCVSPRRARTQFLLRRPRFLRRRSTGSPGSQAPVYQEREIIARD